MKNFVIANADGLVIRVGSCPDSMFDIQAQDDEIIVEGHARPGIDSVVNGEIVVGDDTEQKKWLAQAELRKKRNQLLFKSDLTQLPDIQMTDDLRSQWASYRQALRDLPESYPSITSLDEVEWPQPPQ